MCMLRSIVYYSLIKLNVMTAIKYLFWIFVIATIIRALFFTEAG